MSLLSAYGLKFRLWTVQWMLFIQYNIKESLLDHFMMKFEKEDVCVRSSALDDSAHTHI